ncbi:hypothetical protein ABK040_016433 [Willaertia magna]
MSSFPSNFTATSNNSTTTGSTNNNNQAKLLLHFDVNKTLIINDSAAGKSMDDLISQIIMSSIWGYLINNTFQLLSSSFNNNTLSSTKPQMIINPITTTTDTTTTTTTIDNINNNTLHLINYYEYIEQYLYPYPNYSDDISLEVRKETNKKIKEKRTESVKNFLQTNFGKQFIKHAEELKFNLKCKFQNKENQENEIQYVNIVPAFFELLLELYKRKRDFEILLRTFGTLEDISSVVNEINLFCEGKHLDFPLNDEKQIEFFKQKKILINSKNGMNGCMYRNSNDSCNLILNSLEFRKEMKDFKSISEMTFDNNEIILEGFDKVYKNIINTNQSRVLRDFYEWWHVTNESCIGGKVFLVDIEEKNTFQIFFDDNVCVNPEFPIKGIIDLRNAKTGKPLDQEKYLNIFTVNAYALDFIRNPKYYIEKLDKAEENWKNL